MHIYTPLQIKIPQRYGSVGVFPHSLDFHHSHDDSETLAEVDINIAAELRVEEERERGMGDMYGL